MRQLFLFITISILIPILLIPIIACSRSAMDKKEAQEVLNNFYTDTAPESINDRHLLRAGKAIVPYLMEEIQKSNMAKRRYAIGALGKIGDRRAIPVLVRILEDRSELEYIRGDALEAVWRIDKKMGVELAKKNGGENSYIDKIIKDLRQGR